MATAELSPAVVLVKPTELAGGEDDFRFAPALSWLHHYEPRRKKLSGIWVRCACWIPPPVSMLSSWPSIRPGKVSRSRSAWAHLSFWKNRLEFGAGINLMADSNNEGRFYFFVGTDLIGLWRWWPGTGCDRKRINASGPLFVRRGSTIPSPLHSSSAGFLSPAQRRHARRVPGVAAPLSMFQMAPFGTAA